MATVYPETEPKPLINPEEADLLLEYVLNGNHYSVCHRIDREGRLQHVFEWLKDRACRNLAVELESVAHSDEVIRVWWRMRLGEFSVATNGKAWLAVSKLRGMTPDDLLSHINRNTCWQATGIRVGEHGRAQAMQIPVSYTGRKVDHRCVLKLNLRISHANGVIWVRPCEPQDVSVEQCNSITWIMHTVEIYDPELRQIIPPWLEQNQ